MSVEGITEFCFRDGVVPCPPKPVTDLAGQGGKEPRARGVF
jgi:hypothetical protein